MTTIYSNISGLSPAQKQSQKSPNQTQFLTVVMGAKTNRTQTKPNLPVVALWRRWANPILKGSQMRDKYNLKIYSLGINYPIVEGEPFFDL
jgi:hypothetical protein